MRRQFLWTVVPVFVAFWAFWQFRGATDSLENEATHSRSVPTPPLQLWGDTWNLSYYKTVPKKTWVANKTSLTKLMAHRVPVLLKGTIAEQWAEQPIEDFLALRDVMNGTRVQTANSVFVLRASGGRWEPGLGYHDRVLDWNTADGAPATAITYRNVSVADFVAGNNETSEYMYFTVDLEAWQPPLREQVIEKLEVQVDDSIEPVYGEGDPLPWDQQVWGLFGINQTDFYQQLFGDKKNASEINNPDPHATLWLSQANVTAHWHYDCSHNWFVQLSGSKRILLGPPSSSHDLHLFPSIHPSYHQSQHLTSVYGPFLAHPDRFNDTEGYQSLLNLANNVYAVVVHPGDVLYIPPYWFHTVTALNMSLSLSVISPSEEEMIWSKAFWAKVPFGGLVSMRDKVIVVQHFLQSLLSEPFDDSPSQFVHELLESRYAPHYTDRNYIGCTLPAEFTCYASSSSSITAVRSSLLEKYAEKVRASVTQLTRTLKDTRMLNGKPISPAVLRTLMEDYVENMAVYAVGACNVPAFLSACFPMQ